MTSATFLRPRKIRTWVNEEIECAKVAQKEAVRPLSVLLFSATRLGQNSNRSRTLFGMSPLRAVTNVYTFLFACRPQPGRDGVEP
jgi:hypothetical protein